MAFPCYSAQFPLKVTEGHNQKKKKKVLQYSWLDQWGNVFCISTYCTLIWGWTWKVAWGWVVFLFCFYIKSLLSKRDRRRWKKLIFYEHSITKLNGHQEKRLKCLWGNGNCTLRCWENCSQEASVTYCPIQAPNKNPWTMANFHKGKANFSDWMGQGLVQILLLQPKCTADVSFYVSRAFLSSTWADLSEPWSSFKDFSWSNLTVASLRSRVGFPLQPQHVPSPPWTNKPSHPIFSQLPWPRFFFVFFLRNK